MTPRGFTLLELLCCITVLALMFGLLGPAVVRAHQWAKRWSWAATNFHNNRLELALDNNDTAFAIACTNNMKVWLRMMPSH